MDREEVGSDHHKTGTCAIIGAGNVAWHLAPALQRAGLKVAQVYSHTFEHAHALSHRLADGEAQPISNLADLHTNLDFYILAVADGAVASVAAAMPKVDGIVAHTSGSVDISALSGHRRYGVIYPLQTFSKQGEIDVSSVPFFTEASDRATLERIDALACAIGGEVQHADSRQRGVLHLAAVFACNFANHLWTISDEILSPEGFSIEMFLPLLQLTLNKAMAITPAKAQTGPAVRHDQPTIDKHLAMLNPEHRQIYQMLSQSIQNSHLK